MRNFLAIALLFVLGTSCLRTENQTIPGVVGPVVNVQNGKLLLSIELENVELDGGATLPIPKLEHSQVTLSPALSGGSMIQVQLDPQDLESDNFRNVPPELLPDGRPFPFTVDGTLPAFAFHVPPVFDSTFYLSQDLFALFLPIQLPENFNVSIHYRLRVNGKQIGIVSLIHPNDEGEGAGVFIMVNKGQLERHDDINKLLKVSTKKRYKNRLF